MKSVKENSRWRSLILIILCVVGFFGCSSFTFSMFFLLSTRAQLRFHLCLKSVFPFPFSSLRGHLNQSTGVPVQALSPLPTHSPIVLSSFDRICFICFFLNSLAAIHWDDNIEDIKRFFRGECGSGLTEWNLFVYWLYRRRFLNSGRSAFVDLRRVTVLIL